VISALLLLAAAFPGNAAAERFVLVACASADAASVWRVAGEAVLLRTGDTLPHTHWRIEAVLVESVRLRAPSLLQGHTVGVRVACGASLDTDAITDRLADVSRQPAAAPQPSPAARRARPAFPRPDSPFPWHFPRYVD
jgi:hypothetical protein